MKKHDETKIYCPKLGHHLTFKYCRTQDGNNLCPKIRDCWFTTFDIEKFLATHYTPEEINTVNTPPKPKALTLFELIEQAKKTMQ